MTSICRHVSMDVGVPETFRSDLNSILLRNPLIRLTSEDSHQTPRRGGVTVREVVYVPVLCDGDNGPY